MEQHLKQSGFGLMTSEYVGNVCWIS